MSLNTALEFAKNASEEKVPFRFQFPVHTKKEFEALCEKHGVSMTDMILGLIQSAIDEDKGIYESTTLSIIEKIEQLKDSIKDTERVYRESGDDVVICNDGSEYHLKGAIDETYLKIRALKWELEKRSQNLNNE